MGFTLGILLAFGALTVAFVAFQDFVLERQQVFRSLRRVRAIELAPTEVRRRELAKPFTERVGFPLLKRLGGVGRRLTPLSVIERLRAELVYAGSPPGWDAERILALKVVSVAACGVLGLVLARSVGRRGILLLGLLLFVGWYIPEWALRAKSGRRQNAMRRALPDALDLLSITVEAGLAFDAAVDRVARQEGGPLGEELHRVLQEMRIGKTRSEALRDMSERSTIPELKTFVLAMVQADIFGISVADVLRVQAREMRIKRRQRAEETAQKIPVKIIFPLIFCIFPALFVVLLGPAAIQIYRALIG